MCIDGRSVCHHLAAWAGQMFVPDPVRFKARGMFVRLTKIARWRIARLLAVFYALCVLAPAAAFAFGDGSRAAHCLTESSHHGVQTVQMQAAPMHQHGDGALHTHQPQVADHHSKSDQGNQKAPDAQCCGLICLTALPATDMMAAAPAVLRAPVVLSPPDEITGQSPARLDRPPNSFAAV